MIVSQDGLYHGGTRNATVFRKLIGWKAPQIYTVNTHGVQPNERIGGIIDKYGKE